MKQMYKQHSGVKQFQFFLVPEQEQECQHSLMAIKDMLYLRREQEQKYKGQ